MEQKHTFIEKQYIGRDYIRIAIRLIMAAFCFAAYVYERDRDNTVDLFLVVGFGIIAVSILLLFLIQYKTIIENKKVIIFSVCHWDCSSGRSSVTKTTGTNGIAMAQK